MSATTTIGVLANTAHDGAVPDLRSVAAAMGIERNRQMKTAVVNPLLCKGCACCDTLKEGCSERPAVLCSNMRIQDKTRGRGHAKDLTYRLTTADLVFLAELGV